MSEEKLMCMNTGCEWNKKSRCVLFVGVSVLECRYRKPPVLAHENKTTNKKKGK